MLENTKFLMGWQKRYLFFIMAALIMLMSAFTGILLEMDLADLLSSAVNLVLGSLGLFVLLELKNKALTIGWAIYLSGLVVDLIDEFLTLPVWLDDYFEDAAYGIGLLVIVSAFYLLVKEKQAAADHFKGVSNKDDLTGLYNYRYFYEHFQNNIMKSKELILLFCDLDYFKTVNDVYGHITGDTVLKESAEIIKQTIKDRGITFRYGGEEFAVLLEDCELDEAYKFAESINQNINASQTLQQYAPYFPITVSIGLASYPSNADNARDLVAKADKAMYFSKQKGRNQCTIYSSETDKMLEQGFADAIKQKMMINAVFSLASAIDAKDRYTSRHSELVTKYALQIAESLQLSDDDKFKLRIGALLHDCGKIGVSDEIINKPGDLFDEEFVYIKNHTLVGHNIIKYITDDSKINSCVLYHHERWDGNGYPQGLAGNDIPLFARIISIADAFHAMTSDRPYRRALSLPSALQELKAGANSQFDPSLVKCFIEILQKQEQNSDPPMETCVAS